MVSTKSNSLLGNIFLLAWSSLAVGIAWAAVPSPPPQVCVDQVCTNSSSATSSASGVKWHPGHYMLSNEVTRSASGQTASKRAEQKILLASGSNVVGYAANYTWDVLEPSKGNYDFSQIDADIAANGGKYFIIGVQHIYAPSNHIPSYILNDSAYGTSPQSGKYGFWTGYSGQSFIAAVWRPAVMARWTALFQALADRYDSHPQVVALIDRDETATTMDGGSDYTASNFLTQWRNFGAQVVAHAPRTSIVQQINWVIGGNEAAYFQAMHNNRVAFGGPDIFGLSKGNIDYVAAQAVYRGDMGGVDYRGPKMPMIHDVQSPELTGGLGLYTPQDIFDYANGMTAINYILWNYLGGGGNGDWTTKVLPVINANPVTHKSCPTVYTSCNTN